ncbi:hypothetical protein G7043_22110 [Lentzea sp. NEAU-D13]|uniref:Uncharacterized protein n=1 Tax=Lentzea alba TaxID=2714351 RepID=A0A7C9RSN6_9PSEU|nr:hypothetical protein [Lentzea alba]NGY61627.1 hypothetical protein [Lentzea alba]
MNKLLDVNKVEVVGLFDRWTDVDVFILHGTVRADEKSDESGRGSSMIVGDIPSTSNTADSTVQVLGQVATISIGDVVPHRHDPSFVDKRTPNAVPYITTSNLPIGQSIRDVSESIEWSGRTHKAPFVVLRRTSAPSRGGARLAPSIVRATCGTLAVENHLIVVRPNDGLLKTCEQLAEYLVTSDVTEWLDQAIRTRHLTKRVLMQLPMRGSAGSAGLD